ncbi:amidohydrolase family protein [Salinibacterium sp. TMP30]|uniref:amidohydrolase family protein n=1 Tax=Salinibacterium sp. TMP30 TaxID=3138237 RepID=UPI003138D73B
MTLENLGGAPKIDIHAHYFGERYLRFLEDQDVDTRLGRNSLASAGGMVERLRLLDEAEIEFQIVSGAPLFPTFDNAEVAAEAATLHNDELIEFVASSQGRFGGFIVLPFPHIDESLAELTRVGNLPGVYGCAFGVTGLGRSLVDPEYDCVLERIRDLGIIVFVHPVGNACGFYPAQFDQTWLVGAVFEDAAFVTDLLTSSWLDDHAGIEIVVPHLGGVVPFILQRIDDQFRVRTLGKNVKVPSSRVSALRYDTVNSDPRSLKYAVDVYGADRVMFGTDFPYLPEPMWDDAVHYIRAAGLSDREVQSIEYKNASQLLKRNVAL